MGNRVFKEEQTYRGTWIMYLILLFELPTVVLLIVLYFNAEDKTEIGMGLTFVMITLVLILIFISSLKLETRIDDFGVSFRYFPFVRSWRKIEKSNILSIKVINYSPLTDYGGWGLKGNKTAKAYSILGTEGVLIDTGEKKKIMIGTSKAKELRSYLENWKEV